MSSITIGLFVLLLCVLLLGWFVLLSTRSGGDLEVHLDRFPIVGVLAVPVAVLALAALLLALAALLLAILAVLAVAVVALMLAPIFGLVQLFGWAHWRRRHATTARFESDGIAILRGGRHMRHIRWRELESWRPEYLSAPPRYVHHLRLTDGESWTADFVERQST